jgi:hypothetical protein
MGVVVEDRVRSGILMVKAFGYRGMEQEIFVDEVQVELQMRT